jgi:hypothetical protein
MMLVLVTGYVLLIIPGLILSIWFIFAQFVLVDEDKRGLNSFLASREYVRGHGWSIFGRQTFLIITLIVIFILFSIPFSIFKLDKNIIFSILSSLFSTCTGIFALSYLATMYKNIKASKGGSVDITNKSKAGYIVMAILGIIFILGIPVIAVIAVINPAEQIAKAKAVKATTDKNTIETAVQKYYEDNQYLPVTLGDLVPNYLEELPVSYDETLCYQLSVNKNTGMMTTKLVEKDGSCATKLILTDN